MTFKNTNSRRGDAHLAPAAGQPLDLRLLGALVAALKERVEDVEYRKFELVEELGGLQQGEAEIRDLLGRIGFVPGDALRMHRELLTLRQRIDDIASRVEQLGFAPDAAEALARGPSQPCD